VRRERGGARTSGPPAAMMTSIATAEDRDGIAYVLDLDLEGVF
jgi:hypothetical protein